MKDVKALTNKLLKMYLKQKGLKISGSKAELIDRVLTHARGNLSARDAVEDEESPNSCEDDTSSEFSDSDDSSNDSSTYVEGVNIRHTSFRCKYLNTYIP